MIGRFAAVAAVLLAAVVLAVVLMGGGSTHRSSLVFETAGQLVKDDDVRVGGRRVGSIRQIELTGDNRACVGVEVEEPFAPPLDVLGDIREPATGSTQGPAPPCEQQGEFDSLGKQTRYPRVDPAP